MKYVLVAVAFLIVGSAVGFWLLTPALLRHGINPFEKPLSGTGNSTVIVSSGKSGIAKTTGGGPFTIQAPTGSTWTCSAPTSCTTGGSSYYAIIPSFTSGNTTDYPTPMVPVPNSSWTLEFQPQGVILSSSGTTITATTSISDKWDPNANSNITMITLDSSTSTNQNVTSITLADGANTPLTDKLCATGNSGCSVTVNITLF